MEACFEVASVSSNEVGIGNDGARGGVGRRGTMGLPHARRRRSKPATQDIEGKCLYNLSHNQIQLMLQRHFN